MNYQEYIVAITSENGVTREDVSHALIFALPSESKVSKVEVV